MKGLTKKPMTKADVKAAADRAEARAKGQKVEAKTGPLNPPEDERSRGRPTKYRPEFAAQAQKLCAFGATDFDLAKFFQVDTTTIWRWRSAHPEFCNSIKVGKGAPDDLVERSLYQRAVGYSYEAVKIMQFQGQVIKETYIEHVPPDPGAAMQWLKNRRPKEWQDVRKHEVGGPGDFANMTDEEIVQEIERLAEAEIENMHSGNDTVN